MEDYQDVRIIAVPYDSGHPGLRMGAGPEHLLANEFASEGGPDAEGLEAVLGMIGERFEVAACGIASYDPSFDPEGRVLRAALASASVLTRRTGPG